MKKREAGQPCPWWVVGWAAAYNYLRLVASRRHAKGIGGRRTAWAENGSNAWIRRHAGVLAFLGDRHRNESVRRQKT